jgi:hypothetical protein
LQRFAEIVAIGRDKARRTSAVTSSFSGEIRPGAVTVAVAEARSSRD